MALITHQCSNFTTLNSLCDYRKAEPLYKEALQLKKQLKVVKRSDGSASGSSGDDILAAEGKLAYQSNDVEVKYKLHLCYMNTNQVRASIVCE